MAGDGILSPAKERAEGDGREAAEYACRAAGGRELIGVGIGSGGKHSMSIYYYAATVIFAVLSFVNIGFLLFALASALLGIVSEKSDFD
jgi:hypothetical protein